MVITFNLSISEVSSAQIGDGVTNRNGPWRGLEKHTQNELVDKEDKNLYIFAGGYGNKNNGLPDGHPLKENQIKLPERLWKVVVVLEPGQTLSDVKADTPIIAADFPNDNSDRKEGNWSNYITTINEIEEQIKKEIPGFNLLSNVPEEYRKVLKKKKYTLT
ncbi:MAG: DNA/RNA non-specific endonuclease [Okeania sp. SIO3C4]|nr:DNA/RNA non-specific endonuclease [Okeania sp. SIO3B3]NER05148.1 DNA/RNA non-specific endonuclease [Okeania sp. SIO3C4]